MRRHQRAALRVATAVAGHSRAADAAQEGFVRAFRSLDGFDPERPFRSWLLRIVANAAKNEIRSMDRHHRIEMKLNTLTPIPNDTVDAGELAVAGERRAALAAALARLRHDDRLILALRWFEDLREAEIAEVLEVAPGTVKSRLSRAMGRLRAELAEDHDHV